MECSVLMEDEGCVRIYTSIAMKNGMNVQVSLGHIINVYSNGFIFICTKGRYKSPTAAYLHSTCNPGEMFLTV